MWARFSQDACVIDNWEHASWQTMQPHTWILTKGELPENKVYNYELTLTYKIHTGEEQCEN